MHLLFFCHIILFFFPTLSTTSFIFFLPLDSMSFYLVKPSKILNPVIDNLCMKDEVFVFILQISPNQMSSTLHLLKAFLAVIPGSNSFSSDLSYSSVQFSHFQSMLKSRLGLCYPQSCVPLYVSINQSSQLSACLVLFVFSIVNCFILKKISTSFKAHTLSSHPFFLQ